MTQSDRPRIFVKDILIKIGAYIATGAMLLLFFGGLFTVVKIVSAMVLRGPQPADGWIFLLGGLAMMAGAIVASLRPFRYL